MCSPDGPGKNRYALPILLTHDYSGGRDALLARLKIHDIFARRYFQPLISDLPMCRHLPTVDPARLPISSKVASQILCLPLYLDLDPARQEEIIALVSRE